jgi:PhzF family phenazine biosynthesis protein
MRKFLFKKLDAFTGPSAGGNPAGAIYLDSGERISAEDMQQIARELKGFVSEVGFVCQQSADQYSVSFYSSEREVAFCGHATVAISYDLFSSFETYRGTHRMTASMTKGDVEVRNCIEEQNAVFIAAPRAEYSAVVPQLNPLADALGVPATAIQDSLPFAILNAGLQTLLVPMRQVQQLLALRPKLEVLKAYCAMQDVDILVVFSEETVEGKNRFRTRVFAPSFGYLEDPATGSGNAALGYYALKHGLWNGAAISIEQNASAERPNIVKLCAVTGEDGCTHVEFGGAATTRVSGEYWLS